MKRFLSVIYVVVIAYINCTSFLHDIRDRHYFPIWEVIFGIVFVTAGLVSMVFWAFEFEPKRRWIWKIIPLGLIAYYAVDWYFTFILNRQPDMTSPVIVVTTLVGLLVLYPFFYSTFKFGYED